MYNIDVSVDLCPLTLYQLERFTSMRTKKEKPVMQGNRHSSAAQYEVPSQSSSMHELPDEDVLQLFEQMLVSLCGLFGLSLI